MDVVSPFPADAASTARVLRRTPPAPWLARPFIPSTIESSGRPDLSRPAQRPRPPSTVGRRRGQSACTSNRPVPQAISLNIGVNSRCKPSTGMRQTSAPRPKAATRHSQKVFEALPRHRAAHRGWPLSRTARRGSRASRAPSTGHQQDPLGQRQPPRATPAAALAITLPHRTQQPDERIDPQPGEHLHPHPLGPQHPSYTTDVL